MNEAKTYVGACHCGAVKFEATTDLAKVMACNCSICSKAGWLLTFVPADQFKLISGEDVLADYQFGKKRIHHTFCPRCGIHPFGRGAGHDGKPMFAVNVRCLDRVDVDGLTISNYDGKSL
jgi:hypothetical protein